MNDNIEAAKIICPINNSIIYTDKPRIIFTTNDSDRNILIPYITIKNNIGVFVYTSTRNPEMFSSLSFKKYSHITFIPNNLAEGENLISIRLYNGKRFSIQSAINITYIKPLINEVNNNTKITANLYKDLITMCNATLIAYDKDKVNITIPIKNESKIYRNYFSEVNNKLYDLRNYLNENYPGLNRYKEKQIIKKDIIKADLFNDLLDYILYP